MGEKNTQKAPKSYDVLVEQAFFWTNKGLPTPYPLQNLLYVSIAQLRAPQKLKKIAFIGFFEQKFTMALYKVRIEHVWCYWKARRKSNLLV
jgi:hypothetical protein